MTKRIIEITVETERLLIFHRQGRTLRAWCASCASEVEVVTCVEAASLAGVNQSAIRHRAEAGAIHCVLTTEGEVLVCLKSLYADDCVGL